MNEKHLIFIYNADSGFFSTLSDFAHKVLSPSTYQCQLCALTYRNFSKKNGWKSFIENLPVKVVFLYKDEYRTRYKFEAALPAIFIYDNGLEELLSKDSIDECKTLQELKQLVASKITEHDQHHHSNI